MWLRQQDNDGSTALMCASEHGHFEIVRILLAHSDIDVELTDQVLKGSVNFLLLKRKNVPQKVKKNFAVDFQFLSKFFVHFFISFSFACRTAWTRFTWRWKRVIRRLPHWFTLRPPNHHPPIVTWWAAAAESDRTMAVLSKTSPHRPQQTATYVSYHCILYTVYSNL